MSFASGADHQASSAIVSKQTFCVKNLYTITFCSYATNFACFIKFWSAHHVPWTIWHLFLGYRGISKIRGKIVAFSNLVVCPRNWTTNMHWYNFWWSWIYLYKPYIVPIIHNCGKRSLTTYDYIIVCECFILIYQPSSEEAVVFSTLPAFMHSFLVSRDVFDIWQQDGFGLCGREIQMDYSLR